MPDLPLGETPPAAAGSLLRLAAPLVISRAGLASMTIVDCWMVAHEGGGQLAMTTLAEGTFGRLTDIFAAAMMSALPLIAAARGPTFRDRRKALWQRAVAAALALGLAGLAVAQAAGPILSSFGQSDELSAGAGAVIGILGLGLPAALVAMASAVFLEGTRRPHAVAVIVLAANGLNLALNWLLIGGHLGFPALGALGSAIGTSLVRVALAVALLVAVRMAEGPDLFRPARRDYDGARAQWRLAASMAGTAAGMHALGLWLTVFAGWLGARSLAAYASGWVINMPAMLLAMGLGDAVAIRIAADGRGDLGRRCRHDLAAIGLVLAPFTVVLALAPGAVAALYTSDAALREVLVGLLPLSGLVLLLDGLSYGVASALRGRGDVAGPTGIQLACMAATPLLAAALAFNLQKGVLGMVLAVLATSTARLGLLAMRLAYRSDAIGTHRIQLEHDTPWG